MTNTKQTNVRLSVMTRRQLDTLAELTGMNQSEVIQTAIDRMYQQENKMSSYIHVYMTTDEDSMTGAEGWGEYNEKDSVNAFAQQVEQAIMAAYPGVDVDVETYAAKRSITSDIDGIDDDVTAIIEKAWQSWEWLRK